MSIHDCLGRIDAIADIFGIKRLGGIPPIFFDLDIEWIWDGFTHDHEWELFFQSIY